jgi:hypothetical protein
LVEEDATCASTIEHAQSGSIGDVLDQLFVAIAVIVF